MQNCVLQLHDMYKAHEYNSKTNSEEKRGAGRGGGRERETDTQTHRHTHNTDTHNTDTHKHTITEHKARLKGWACSQQQQRCSLEWEAWPEQAGA